MEITAVGNDELNTRLMLPWAANLIYRLLDPFTEEDSTSLTLEAEKFLEDYKKRYVKDINTDSN